MNRYILSSEELLILRDGRPFGDTGTFGGTAMEWPLPQTLAGMCRTALGHARDDDTFKKPEAVKALLNIGLEKLLPCLLPPDKHKENPEILLPVPGDLVFMESESGKDGNLRIYPLRYGSLKKGEGTDLQAKEWLYPSLAFKGKPMAPPRFLRQNLAHAYISGSLNDTGRDVEMDTETIAGPVRDFRIHVALEPETRTAWEGRLYGESGIYLKAIKTGIENRGRPLPGLSGAGTLIGSIGIGFSVTGLSKDEKMPSSLYLGGERRRADFLPAGPFPFPKPPEGLENQRFLKFLLITHGDFGGWAPQWLLPETEGSEFPWVREPISNLEIRLQSAVVAGWEPVSGWDMELKKPKATRKLVRPGTVYLVELKNPLESDSLVQTLWGQSLCNPGSREKKDGFGQILLAKAHTITNGKDI